MDEEMSPGKLSVKPIVKDYKALKLRSFLELSHTLLSKRKPAWKLHPLDAEVLFCSFSVAIGLCVNQVKIQGQILLLNHWYLFPSSILGAWFKFWPVLSLPSDICHLILVMTWWIIPTNHELVRWCVFRGLWLTWTVGCLQSFINVVGPLQRLGKGKS